jgi:Asp-tRNA(Asn)/Glu-tRNA(Gln) amidotransferase A subunit family amidase
MGVFSALGLSSTLMPGVLWAAVQETKREPELPRITKPMIDDAAEIAGVEISDADKDMMLNNLNDALKSYKAIYDLKMPNSVPPAVSFNPVLPGMKIETAAPLGPKAPRLSAITAPGTPKNLEDAAFYTVRQLAELVRTRKVSSTALTQMYLERLKRYDPKLHFVVTLTEDRALAQAKQADADIAVGKYRGQLHGLPWGAKDLLAVKNYPTTWGAHGFEEQKFDDDATVVKRLDAAGAVLVAKTTLGALALGDFWQGHDGKGERTRNPWRPEQGSSGSSAGSASATAAGCVAFSVGSETLGSISSPATRCGDTGLRPTFGRVPRTGAMALSWTMDKLGPLCRAVEDCALVLSVISGPDGQDGTVHDYPFVWNPVLDIKKLRVGYVKSEFEKGPTFPDDATPEIKERITKTRAFRKKFDEDTVDVLRSKLGLNLVAVEMPKLPYSEMLTMLSSEAAAAFDDLTRSGRDKLLNAQGPSDWPNSFRSHRFVPAVEYIQAARARTLGMRAMADVFKNIDVFVAPTDTDQIVITNLTGHPAVILPNGFRPADAPVPTAPTQGGGPGTPVSITFVGNLFREDQLCAVAKAYQDATEFHLKWPSL